MTSQQQHVLIAHYQREVRDREWMTIRKSDKHHRNNVLRDSAHVLYSCVAHVSFQES